MSTANSSTLPPKPSDHLQGKVMSEGEKPAEDKNDRVAEVQNYQQDSKNHRRVRRFTKFERTSLRCAIVTSKHKDKVEHMKNSISSWQSTIAKMKINMQNALQYADDTSEEYNLLLRSLRKEGAIGESTDMSAHHPEEQSSRVGEGSDGDSSDMSDILQLPSNKEYQPPESDEDDILFVPASSFKTKPTISTLDRRFSEIQENESKGNATFVTIRNNTSKFGQIKIKDSESEKESAKEDDIPAEKRHIKVTISQDRQPNSAKPSEKHGTSPKTHKGPAKEESRLPAKESFSKRSKSAERSRISTRRGRSRSRNFHRSIERHATHSDSWKRSHNSSERTMCRQSQRDTYTSRSRRSVSAERKKYHHRFSPVRSYKTQFRSRSYDQDRYCDARRYRKRSTYLNRKETSPDKRSPSPKRSPKRLSYQPRKRQRSPSVPAKHPSGKKKRTTTPSSEQTILPHLGTDEAQELLEGQICVFCKSEEHSSKDCVLGDSSEIRRKFCEYQGYCKICASREHRTKKCKSKYQRKCKRCEEMKIPAKHGTFVCPIFMAGRQQKLEEDEEKKKEEEKLRATTTSSNLALPTSEISLPASFKTPTTSRKIHSSRSSSGTSNTSSGTSNTSSGTSNTSSGSSRSSSRTSSSSSHSSKSSAISRSTWYTTSTYSRSSSTSSNTSSSSDYTTDSSDMSESPIDSLEFVPRRPGNQRSSVSSEEGFDRHWETLGAKDQSPEVSEYQPPRSPSPFGYHRRTERSRNRTFKPTTSSVPAKIPIQIVIAESVKERIQNSEGDDTRRQGVGADIPAGGQVEEKQDENLETNNIENL
ncbi:hypothetical protein GCK72_001818 [Caenorhabditis remanei]|uniref:Uncharacterized protein n=1 Tax=Caenorhabditis remanei TaxID=31234 RepID=A0A6A5HRT8_CAERE|nr:hypothetical protein GCK72_001818 [Caenorhabditis remanei]KAF1770001.1 hypothetical protein GCK72_001818 [Caenorhabditis remanei]